LTRSGSRRSKAAPQRYLQSYRFSKAVQLLRTTDAKIYEIARRVGYDSESSFSKAFKRLMGKSPGAYRWQDVGRGDSPFPSQ